MPGVKKALFTQLPGETVWKIADGSLDGVCSMEQECEMVLLYPHCPLMGPQTGGYPDFPNSFGRGIPRSSSLGGSRKSDPAVPSEARGARVGRTAQNSTPKIYLSVVAPPPVPQYHRRHPNGRRRKEAVSG